MTVINKFCPHIQDMCMKEICVCFKKSYVQKNINNDIVVFDQYICNGFTLPIELGREIRR